jgi:hypothetical protein
VREEAETKVSSRVSSIVNLSTSARFTREMKNYFAAHLHRSVSFITSTNFFALLSVFVAIALLILTRFLVVHRLAHNLFMGEQGGRNGVNHNDDDNRQRDEEEKVISSHDHQSKSVIL